MRSVQRWRAQGSNVLENNKLSIFTRIWIFSVFVLHFEDKYQVSLRHVSFDTSTVLTYHRHNTLQRILHFSGKRSREVRCWKTINWVYSLGSGFAPFSFFILKISGVLDPGSFLTWAVLTVSLLQYITEKIAEFRCANTWQTGWNQCHIAINQDQQSFEHVLIKERCLHSGNASDAIWLSDNESSESSDPQYLPRQCCTDMTLEHSGAPINLM